MHTHICSIITHILFADILLQFFSAAAKAFDYSFSRHCGFQHECNHFYSPHTYLLFCGTSLCTKPVYSQPTSASLNAQLLVKLVLGAPAALHCLLWAKQPRPCSPRVCRLSIHLGKDTQRWHFLSAQGYKPGDLSATTRPAVNWAHFMEAAGDYLQLCFPPRLQGLLEKFISTTVFFQRQNQASLRAAVSLNKARLPATLTYRDQHMLAGGQTRVNTDGRHLN